MATATLSKGNERPVVKTRSGRSSESYDRKLEGILRQAAAVFCDRGYHQASIRDIARATGVSLAGLYYYFSSKEELLYLIQRHTFEAVLADAQQRIELGESPEGRLRALIDLHLQFFLQHPNEMKVLTHEEEWLGRRHAREVRAIKRAYYKLCLQQVEALKKSRHLHALNTRLAVLSLFGMMNWIYTWYNPKVDPSASMCADTMAGIFLEGILGGSRVAKNGATKAVNGNLTQLDSWGGRRLRPSNGIKRPTIGNIERSRSASPRLERRISWPQP